jgi:hypothetical protein
MSDTPKAVLEIRESPCCKRSWLVLATGLRGLPGRGIDPVLSLTQVLGHLEGVADRAPDDLGVYPVRESALDRAPA